MLQITQAFPRSLKTKSKSKLGKLFLIATVAIPLSFANNAYAQINPIAADSTLPTFTCDSSFFEVTSGQLVVLDVTVSPGVYTPIGPVAPGSYNGTGFNFNDGYIYGTSSGASWGAEDQHLIRIGSDGNYEAILDLGRIGGQGVMIGDFLYFGNGKNIRTVNVSTGAETGLAWDRGAVNGSIVDWSHLVIGTQDFLVGAARELSGETDGAIYRVNTSTGDVTASTVPGLPPANYGASWSTSDGLLYFAHNNTGTVYIIDGAEGSSPKIIGELAAASSGNHDGMNCFDGGNPFGSLPELTVTKTASAIPPSVSAGDTITYTFEVENSGPISIDDVVPVEAGVTINGTPGTGTLSGITIVTEAGFVSTDLNGDDQVDRLDTGETAKFEATYTLTAADIDAMNAASDPLTAIDNSATASGSPLIGTLQPVTPSIVETGVEPFTPAPSLAFEKVADDDTDRVVGDVITYTYTVENTGNVDIDDVTIDDQHTSASGTSTLPVSGETGDAGNSAGSTDAASNGSWDVLAPGDIVTFTSTYTVTEADVVTGGDITNTATVTGDPVAGDLPTDPITADESVTVALKQVDLSLTKTNTPGVNGEVDQAVDTLTSGDTTTYVVTVTNNGPDSVAGALVTDTIVEGLTCPASNAVSFAGDGVPSGSFTVADLTGAGIALDTLADGEAATLSYDCSVD